MGRSKSEENQNLPALHERSEALADLATKEIEEERKELAKEFIKEKERELHRAKQLVNQLQSGLNETKNMSVEEVAQLAERDGRW